jgi:XTP/dITP diphosphohydrolase
VPTLAIATANPGKLREFRVLLAGLGITLRSLADFPPAPAPDESAATYRDNARAKARALAARVGLPALADDSGLEVDALGGAPGVRSARFAADAGGTGTTDADNVGLLLAQLAAVPEARRTARFRCTIVVARPDGRELVTGGTCDGTIALAPRGRGGFGYDPIFFFPPLGRTFAELPGEEKDRVSHRAAAVAALRPALLAFLL